MNWYDRNLGNLNSAFSSGAISQAEYNSGIAGLNAKADKRARNSANFQNASSALSTVGSMAGQFSNTNGSLDDSSAQAREGMRNTIGQMGPWGAIISAASGVVDSATDALGVSWETVDKNAADRAGVGGAAQANNLLASIPGNSVFGVLMKETEKANKSQFIDGMSNSFGGSVADINAAQQMGGKRVAFGRDKMNSFIREQNRVNSIMTSIGIESEMAKQNDAGQLYQVQNANKYSGYSPRLIMSKKGMKFQDLDSAREILKNIKNKKTGVVMNAIDADISTLSNPDSGVNIAASSSLLASSLEDGKLQPKELSTHVKNQIYDSSQDPEGIAMKLVENISANKEVLKESFRKNGLNDAIAALDSPETVESMKILSDAIKLIIANKSYENGGEIGKFQLGGKIDKNFIPQGALHKNKHHLEDVNPELEGSITKKGIPVISMNEGGEIQQHAEVEKNEIVFSLDTTKTVEDLYRQYQETEDESILIECGKFITNEIMKNTEDPGKLRKTIE